MHLPLPLLLVTPQVLSLGRPFQGVVVEQLLNQIHVRHEHAAAAVAAEANGVQRLTVGVWGRCGGYGKQGCVRQEYATAAAAA